MRTARRRIELLLALLVLVAPSGGAAVAARPPGAGAVVMPALAEALDAAAPDARLPVIVTLRGGAALDPSASLVGGARAERLQDVITRLQGTATAAQGPILAYLEGERAAGRAGPVTPFWVFSGLAVEATPEVIAALSARTDVARLALDATYPAPALAPADVAAGENLALIGATALWADGFTGQGVVVATVDTGVYGGHPALRDRYRGGTNSWRDVTGEFPLAPRDPDGHGTAVMGVLVGGDEGGRAIGVAPGAQWIAVKVFRDGQATASGVHAAFQWLLDPDGNPSTDDAPHVVNASLGLPSAGCDDEFRPDLQALRAAGIVPVFSAGNGGPGAATGTYPAILPPALAVGATNGDDLIAPTSSRGPSPCDPPGAPFPELTAPGVGVYTASRYGGYALASGTSLAAPHAAGALALLLSARPGLSAGAQEAALLDAAVDLGVGGPDNAYGHGRLDVHAALAALPPATSPPPTLPPPPTPTTPAPGATATPTRAPTATPTRTPTARPQPVALPLVFR
jgi:subtilisin family serine protease